MANLRLTNDLINDALFRAGEPVDGTSDYNTQMLPYINRAYRAIWNGGAELDPEINERWWWLLATAPGVLPLEPYVSKETANVANSNSTVNFATGPTQSTAGWYFKVDTHPDIFRINAHISGATQATLDQPYTGPSLATASYRLFKLDYALPTTLLYIISPLNVYRDVGSLFNQAKIDGIDIASLDRDYPLRNITARVPQKFAPIGERTIRFSHYGPGATTGDLTRVDYVYMQEPADLTTGASDIPLVPLQYRYIIADYARWLLHEDKNDNRAGDALAVAKSGVKAMSVENRRRMAQLDSNVGAIHPRPLSLPQYRAPLRTESGLIIG